MTVVEFPKSKATARQEARRLAASKLRKDEGAAKSRAPRETMAERREAMSVLATACLLYTSRCV